MRDKFRSLILFSLTAACGSMPGLWAQTTHTATAESWTLPAGTQIRVRLGQSIDTRRDRAGTPFVAHIATPLIRRGEVILPRGAVCRGHVSESRPSGRLKGRAVLQLTLDSIERNGRKYTIETSDPSFVSKSHKERNLALIGGTATTGAVIGGIAGAGPGLLIGAGAGAVAGTTTALVTGKRNLHLAPETAVTFRLRQGVRIRG